MATRRSRLQIKPNIGGPKTGGAKPTPTLKIPDQNTRKAEGRAVGCAFILNIWIFFFF